MSNLDPLDPDRQRLAGALRIQLLRRIGPEWRDLAVLCGLPAEQLPSGYEAYGIWDWLDRRGRLDELPEMLAAIGRGDLVELLVRHSAPGLSRPDHRQPNGPLTFADTVGAGELFGRAGPRDALRALLTAATGGGGCFVLVEGEPGIGKTALVRATATEAVRAGCRVFWAACDPLDRAFPLQPLVDALDAGRPPAGGPFPPDYRVDLVAVRTERVLTALASAAPAVLVIDDLQWADSATLFTLGRLARTVRRRGSARSRDGGAVPGRDRGGLLVVGVTRPVPDRAELAALRRLVGRAILLPPLASPEVAALVERTVGGRPSKALLRMAAGAAGNPLYLTELLDALARDRLLTGHNGAVDVRAGVPPASLPAAIAHRLDFLRPPVRRVLEAAALLGDEFAAEELAVVAGRRVPKLWPYLDEAIRAGVLHDRNGLLAFRHGLLRMALYDQTPRPLRIAAHWEAARALAERAAPVDRVARQLLPTVGTPGSTGTWTARWLARSAQQLVSQAPAVAISLLRWELAGKPTGVAPHDELVCRLADALFRVGDAAGAEKVAEAALDQVTRADLVVDLLWTLAQCRAASGRSRETLERLRDALESPSIGVGQRARLLVLTARVHRGLGDIDTACLAAEEALTMATEAGDRAAAGWALGVLSLTYGMRGDAAQALPLFDKALALAGDQPALADLRLMLLVNRAVALSDLDRYPEAIAAVTRARALAANATNRVRLAQAESVLADLWFDTGQWDAVIRLVEGRSGSCADPGVRCCEHGMAALIGLHRGDPAAHRHLADAEPFARRLDRRLIGPLVLARALHQEQAGDRRGALAVLLASISASTTEISEVTGLLADAVRLALLVGQRSSAETVADLAQRIGTSDVPHRRAVSYHCKGLLDKDASRLVRAAERYRQAGRLLPCAQALEAASATAADQGDPRQAGQYRDNAVRLYRTLHADWDLARLSGQECRAA